jgi:hypothetical protein
VRLNGLYRVVNGIKHVWNPAGWPFGNKPHLSLALLQEAPSLVLHLQRRNALQRVVSAMISEQVQLWKGPASLWRLRLDRLHLAPLDVESVVEQLRIDLETEEKVSRLLRRLNKTTVSVFYEDLFESHLNKGAGSTVNSISDLMERLGFDAPDHEMRLVMARRLDPTTWKMNSQESYKLIPNIEEVEAVCGSDDTGWLFPDRDGGLR